MPAYNAYTNTNDFPLKEDFYPIDNTGRVITPSRQTTSQKLRVNQDYLNATRQWIQKYNIPQSIIDEWNRLTQQAFDDATAKNFWQRMAEKVTNTVNNFLSQAEQVLKNAGENVALAPLLPFKVAMVNALKRQGENVTLSTKLGTVASLFKQKVIDRSSTTNYEHAENEGLTTDQILQLIDKIIPFFTLILEKVKSGKATSEERLINGDAESEANKATGGGVPTQTGINAPTGENWFSKYKFVIIGAVAVVLFLAFRKKK